MWKGWFIIINRHQICFDVHYYWLMSCYGDVGNIQCTLLVMTFLVGLRLFYFLICLIRFNSFKSFYYIMWWWSLYQVETIALFSGRASCWNTFMLVSHFQFFCSEYFYGLEFWIINLLPCSFVDLLSLSRHLNSPFGLHLPASCLGVCVLHPPLHTIVKEVMQRRGFKFKNEDLTLWATVFSWWDCYIHFAAAPHEATYPS